MSELVVVAFDDEQRASEALAAAKRLENQHELWLQDAAVVIHRQDGKLRFVETRDVRSGEGALYGGFWGLLFGAILFAPALGLVAGAGVGALAARFHDHGISDSFQHDIGHHLQPGTSAVLLLIERADLDAALAEAARFEGHVLRTELPAATEQALRDAIEPSRDGGDARG